MATTVARPRWSELSLSARLFRVAHGTWGAFNLIGLALVWRAGITRQRDRRVYASAGLLLAEGAALVVGRVIARSVRFNRAWAIPCPCSSGSCRRARQRRPFPC